ncbi:ribonuclease P protein component [Natranaerovirga hydrolytica]|uniref:Ribonuclease P protein component n=1 Tax=Natranaerovirga hydrolytica TaxID=680378 RepID=A0A4V6NF70_9FIRM|nr:ribonuclease P protein component [Natranaerovirga hydrolytica]TCK86791.1 ribonuclease P protein component [Natranaerovirga hydrolytica]
MKFSESLKRNSDFKEVYSYGKSSANKYLVMYVKKNNLCKNRLGITVSKKVGNSPIRHRVTRLIRESYRLNEKDIKMGYDIVIIARVKSSEVSYNEISSSFINLLEYHHLLNHS